jgi:pyridoxal phosphate phosphatase PHOSPHO2
MYCTVTPSFSKMPNSTLIIFDYDWSLVDENSDIYIFKVLCPQLLDTIELRRKDSPSWTRLIDELLGELSTLRPHLSLSELKEVLAKIPVQDGMLEAVAHALQKNAIIKIISDANTFYIRSFLDHHGLSTHISEIFTNHAYFDENNRLRVSPYHSLDYEPHGCSFCPANMCKGMYVIVLM